MTIAGLGRRSSPTPNRVVARLPNVTLVGIDCCNVSRIQKALAISSAGIEFGAVKLLTSLPTGDPRRVAIPHLASLEDYSAFCVRDLVDYVDTDFALLVQHDGFVLNPDSWEDEFLRYDYVGAPWLVNEGTISNEGFPRELLGQWVVGNGGFSLRSRKYLEAGARLAREGALEALHPEDDVLCIFNRQAMERAGIVYAPIDVAWRFSLEGRRRPYDRQFGFHSLSITDISSWIRANPQWRIELQGKHRRPILGRMAHGLTAAVNMVVEWLP